MYRPGKRSQPPSDPEKAFQAAMRTAENILAYADNSERMLRAKLLDRGYLPETADRVADKLTELGELDEMRSAENICRSLASGKLYGWARIKSYLLSKGYDSRVVARLPEMLDDVDFDENCLVLLTRLGGEKNRDNYMKLRRHGFSYENIRYAYDNTES